VAGFVKEVVAGFATGLSDIAPSFVDHIDQGGGAMYEHPSE